MNWNTYIKILMNNNGYSYLSFPTLLIKKVAKLIDARTLQFFSVGDLWSRDSMYDSGHERSNYFLRCN